MATHTTSGNKFPGRTFSISRENGQNDKNGRPHFFEWIQVIPEQPGNRKFESRPSKSGTRHYELFAALSGFLTGIETEKQSFGENKPEETWLILFLHDEGEDYKVKVGPMDGRYSMDVMKRLLDPAFDPMLQLRISPFAIEGDDGRQVIGLAAHSGMDGKLEAKRECAHLQGIAQPETREWKGQKEWDFSNVAQWLFAQVSEKVVPKLGAVERIETNIRPSAAANTFPTNNAEMTNNPALAEAGFPREEPESDLPF